MANDAATVDTIDLTPDWPNLLEWSANVLAQHGFDRNAYSPVVALMEMAVKVYQDDPKMFKQICDALTRRDGEIRPITVHYHQPSHTTFCEYCSARIQNVNGSWVDANA